MPSRRWTAERQSLPVSEAPQQAAETAPRKQRARADGASHQK
jgi:hypothetical protein